MRRSLLLALLLAVAVPPARAAVRFDEAAVGIVTLHAPLAGSVLAGGDTATLAWEPRGGALPPDVEEWEAFLSVDGGKSYPLRITPHLDVDVRRVQWRVPAIATREARLLLRFGDEGHERMLAVPGEWTIEPSATASALPLLDAKTWRASASAGEPARPGDAGVVAWIEGPRDGTHQRAITASTGATLVAALTTRGPEAPLALLLPAPSTSLHALPRTDGGAAQAPPVPHRRALAPPGRRARGVPILLQSRRRNE